MLSALSTVFALAAANKAFVEGETDEQQWGIAGSVVREFNQVVPKAVHEHLCGVRGMLATATAGVTDTVQ